MPEAAMFSTFNVTTPADDLSLLTIEELRAALGVTGTAEDAALKALGLRLSASIARQCCIASDGINPATLMLETCTETFRAVRPQNELILARRPVTAIVSVSESGAIVDPADYEIRRNAGILARLIDQKGSVDGCPCQIHRGDVHSRHGNGVTWFGLNGWQPVDAEGGGGRLRGFPAFRLEPIHRDEAGNLSRGLFLVEDFHWRHQRKLHHRICCELRMGNGGIRRAV
jgi:hypothetical protein